MEEDEYIESVLRLLDAAGMYWLTDEVRELRFVDGEPSVGHDDVAQSRRTYNRFSGESPFAPIGAPGERGGPKRLSSRECIEFMGDRVESIASQIEEAILDASKLGIVRIHLGLGGSGDARPAEIAEILRSLAANIRASAAR